MKSKSLLVLACLFSIPTFAQLPDEINYGPYETRFRNLEKETSLAQTQLNLSRTSLAEAQRFIREMMAHIENLHEKIQDTEAEISELRREIPELERRISNLRAEDSRLLQEIRGRQYDESSLMARLQDAQRDLRPLEDILARREQRLRELQMSLNHFQRLEREAASKLSRTQAEAERIDRQHLELRNQQRRMQEELRNVEASIASVQSQISSQESKLAEIQSSLNQERGKLAALNGRVSEFEAEVARLRSAGSSAEEVAQAERKLSSVRSNRDKTANDVRNFESQVSRIESQIRTLRSQMGDIRRNQTTLPGRISEVESRMRQLESQRGQLQAELQRYGAEFNTVRRNVEVRERELVQLRSEVRNDEQNVLRQRQFVDTLNRQIQGVRSEINSLTQRSRNLNAEIARSSETARSHEVRIPRLQQDIRTFRQEITEGESELATARNDERTFQAKVQREEAILADLTGRRNSAESEMRQRVALYQTYQSEAEKIGSSQAQSGTILGKQEGDRLITFLSRQNGSAVGKEMGQLEARHWGSVRGEIEGYDIGYMEGLASAEDIGRATREASQKAADDAELFAQKNFKPVFFEEYVQEEFKKPFFKSVVALKSFKTMAIFSELAARENVPALSVAEIERSKYLITPLDVTIQQLEKDLKNQEGKVKRISNPEVAFEVPTKIPFGSVDCSKVYKGLAVFKTSCEGSYKESFSNNYISAAKETFHQSYESRFFEVYQFVNVQERESLYPAELKSSAKIGRAVGSRIGKIEIYQTTFESVYQKTYVSQLEIARAKAKGDARAELTSFLKTKPLLTVESSDLAAENFRGGEDILVNTKVKNISEAPLNGPVMVRITSLQNAERVTGDAVLNTAGPLAVSDLPSLKIKVSSTARAGEKVVVKGIVEMPGDLYKATRQETFELSQVLSANPAHSLVLDFNRTPDIKGPFRRYIHFLSAKIAPSVEDIREGYELRLTPVGEAVQMVEMKESVIATGSLSASAVKETRFSYVFKDQAKGRSLNFDLTVNYLGRVIKKESVTISPK